MTIKMRQMEHLASRSTAKKKPAAAAKIQPSKTPLVVEEAPDKIRPWVKHKPT